MPASSCVSYLGVKLLVTLLWQIINFILSSEIFHAHKKSNILFQIKLPTSSLSNIYCSSFSYPKYLLPPVEMQYQGCWEGKRCDHFPAKNITLTVPKPSFGEQGPNTKPRGDKAVTRMCKVKHRTLLPL